MPDMDAVRRRIHEVPVNNQRLTVSDFTLSANSQGQLTKIAEYKAERPFSIRQGIPFDLHLVAYESKTTDGTGGNTETFSLSYNLVDAASVATDLLLVDDGTVVEPDSIDYANDEFDYTDADTGSDLDVFYLAEDQALVQFRQVAPKNITRTISEKDAGLANIREQTKDPLTFDFDDLSEALIPTDWRLEVYLNAPYTHKFENDATGATADNMLLDIPIAKANEEIDNLGWAIKEQL